MKFKTVIIITLGIILFSVLGFLYSSRGTVSNNNQTKIDEKTKEPVTKQAVFDVSSIESAAVEDAQSRPKPESKSTSKVDVKDLDKDYKLPEQGNILDFTKKLLAELAADKTGKSNFMLGKISDYCSAAPKDGTELSVREKDNETETLTQGGSNGDVQKNVAIAQNHYSECIEIKKLLGDRSSYDYYFDAAVQKLPRAEVQLAAFTAPPNFANWSEDEKVKYQNQVGAMLEDARNSCDRYAFKVFAYDQQMERGNLWQVVDTSPPNVSRLGNLIAYGIYYSRNTSNSSSVISGINSSLSGMAAKLAMSESDIDAAKKLGQDLYAASCH